MSVPALGPTATHARTVYVSTAGNDANDGLSWPTAELAVQAGLSAAVSGDQVWVAAASIVDLGACEHRLTDANGDGCVDVADLLGVVYAFGTIAGDPAYDVTCDFDHDGAVNVVDLLDLVYNFGTQQAHGGS